MLDRSPIQSYGLNEFGLGPALTFALAEHIQLFIKPKEKGIEKLKQTDLQSHNYSCIKIKFFTTKKGCFCWLVGLFICLFACSLLLLLLLSIERCAISEFISVRILFSTYKINRLGFVLDKYHLRECNVPSKGTRVRFDVRWWGILRFSFFFIFHSQLVLRLNE